MTTQHPTRSVSRRTALASLGAGGFALATAGHTVAAQDSSALADHPMVGVWMAVTPEGPAPSFVMADGSFHHSSAPISVDADGAITYWSPQNGVWEPDPDNERGIHFTSVQNIHDATGALTGTFTVDGYPVASEDGQSFYDDGTRVRLTLRDATNTVTMVLGEDGSLPPIFGIRMAPGAPGFQEGTPEAGTPTS
jgi:hypothetical protein